MPWCIEELAERGIVDIKKANLVPIVMKGPQAMLDHFWTSVGSLVTNNPLSSYQHAVAFKLDDMNDARYIDFHNTLGKLRELNDIASTADYSGMSDAEKALAIYNRWDEAFGDFRKSRAIQYPRIGAEQPDSVRILQQFGNELESVFGSVERAEAAYRTALYGNMSNAQIRETIAAKYPPMNEITLREFHEMVFEMKTARADEGMWQVLMVATTENVSTLVREELLDQRLDVSWFASTYNAMRNASAKTFYNDVGNSGTVMRELFGITFDSRGNAIANSQSPVDYRTLISQLSQKYNNWKASDCERWLYAQFEKEHEQWIRDNQQWIIETQDFFMSGRVVRNRL